MNAVVCTVAEVAETFGWLPKLLASFATSRLTPRPRWSGNSFCWGDYIERPFTLSPRQTFQSLDHSS